MQSIHEPAREVPIIHKADICVLGGSATGVFAAVRAARLGRSVIIIEKTNSFGGVATNGLVNIWHSPMNTTFDKDIIGGLTIEAMQSLEKRQAVQRNQKNPSSAFQFNSEELKLELDALITEHSITPMLHTLFCNPIIENGRITAVIIENKDGRAAVQADVFIDATGDGDLFARCNVPFGVDEHLQPPTTCAKMLHFYHPDLNYREFYKEHYQEFGLKLDSGWSCEVPGLENMQMFAQTHVFDVNCADAAQLTHAEMEGRRQVRAIMDMIRKYGPQGETIKLAALPSYIGIRETRRFHSEYILTEEDVLWGRSFPDTIAQGSYRVDVHHPDGGGFIFKYLDGTTLDIRAEGNTNGRWRDPIDEDPTYYQIPYRTMIHKSMPNAIMAGRMIGTDKGAFGAVRVMVNLNQTGEAAGTAAHLALKESCSVIEVDPKQLRDTLNQEGSMLID